MVVAWGCSLLLTAGARSVRRLVQLPALLCCEAMVWAVSFLAFPLRMLSAMDRERKLGALVGEMQAQMEGLAWENRELEARLRAAVEEQEATEAVLDEMEDEHDAAVARVRALDAQVRALKQENMRLKEHKGKSAWDNPPPPEAEARRGKKPARSRGREEEEEEAVAAAAARDDRDAFVAATTSLPGLGDEEASLARQAKLVARRRSLFSLGMSLAVGAAAWSADAPPEAAPSLLLPLLAGLVAVVGVSMRSVARSCAELRRGGPAADAVALLGLNWFLLGVLASPMLPGLARALVPRAGRVLGPAVAWLAAAAPL